MKTLLLFVLTAFPLLSEVEVRGLAGVTNFSESSAHAHLGAALRYYLTSRVSAEAEWQYLRENDVHHDLVLMGSVAYDFRSKNKRIVPYVVGGAGALWERYKGTIATRTNTGLHISAGAGAKVFVRGNWFVAPEFRTGFSAHARFTVALGYLLGR